MKMKSLLITASIVAYSSSVFASELVYRPINPSLGGDPLNGNFLLSAASAQTDDAGGGSPDFSIDFPDFGGITQPTPTPTPLPEVPTAPTAAAAPATGG